MLAGTPNAVQLNWGKQVTTDWYSIFSEASVSRIEDRVSTLHRESDRGSALAAHILSDVFSPNSVFSPEVKRALDANEAKSESYSRLAFERFEKLVESGDGEAAFYLSEFYQNGRSFVQQNIAKCLELNELALAKGFEFAANNLVSIYSSRFLGFYDPDRANELKNVLQTNGALFVQVPNDDKGGG